MGSLKVENIGEEVEASQILSIFSQIGSVTDVSLSFDPVTNKPIALVKYRLKRDAEKALLLMDSTTINDYVCTVSRASESHSEPVPQTIQEPMPPSSSSEPTTPTPTPTPTSRPKIGGVTVNGLPSNITEEEINKLFSKFGTVVFCELSGQTATVFFEQQSMADVAINWLNGTAIKGSLIAVTHASAAEDKNKQICVTNVPLTATYKEIESLLSKFGKLTKGALLSDSPDVGYALFTYESAEDAASACSYLNSTTFKGNQISVTKGPQKEEETPPTPTTTTTTTPTPAPITTNITPRNNNTNTNNNHNNLGKSIHQNSGYDNPFGQEGEGEGYDNPFGHEAEVEVCVKNLGYEISENYLAEMFERFGGLTRVSILRNNQGVSKGIAFVRFTSHAEARQALSMNNQRLGSRNIRVEMSRGGGRGRGGRGRGGRGGGRGSRVYNNSPSHNMTNHNSHHHHHHHHHHNENISSPAPTPTSNNHQNRNDGGNDGIPEPPSAVPDELTKEYLSNFPPAQQFFIVSQQLYPIISKTQPRLVGKITMLLRQWYLGGNKTPSDLLHLLNHPPALRALIDEALKDYEEHIKEEKKE